jgi:hypothetical protein
MYVLQESVASVDHNVVQHFRFRKCGNQIGGRNVLGVHIDADFAACQIQGLLEGRDLGAGELRAELNAGIQHTNLVEGHFADSTGAVCGAVNFRIVHQHQAAIRGGTHVQLKEGGAGINGGLKCGKRVFRMRAVLTPMGNDRNGIGRD